MIAQDLVGLPERFFGKVAVREQVLPHAHGLRALAGKNKCSVVHFITSLNRSFSTASGRNRPGLCCCVFRARIHRQATPRSASRKRSRRKTSLIMKSFQSGTSGKDSPHISNSSALLALTRKCRLRGDLCRTVTRDLTTFSSSTATRFRSAEKSSPSHGPFAGKRAEWRGRKARGRSAGSGASAIHPAWERQEINAGPGGIIAIARLPNSTKKFL